MEIRRSFDLGPDPEKGARYLIQWETLHQNFDKPRQPPLPDPSILRVHKLVRRTG